MGGSRSWRTPPTRRIVVSASASARATRLLLTVSRGSRGAVGLTVRHVSGRFLTYAMAHWTADGLAGSLGQQAARNKSPTHVTGGGTRWIRNWTVAPASMLLGRVCEHKAVSGKYGATFRDSNANTISHQVLPAPYGHAFTSRHLT